MDHVDMPAVISDLFLVKEVRFMSDEECDELIEEADEWKTNVG